MVVSTCTDAGVVSDGRKYPTRPYVGVGGVVLKDNCVLLVRRAKPPRAGEWSLPGGAQRVGETVEEALVREIDEETGVTVGAARLVDVIDAITHDQAGRVAFHYTLVDLTAAWVSGEARPGGDVDAVAWVPLDGLAPYDLWFETVRVIEASTKS